MDGQPNQNPAPINPVNREDALGIRPGPALQPETEFRERMSEESPDGRPPAGPARRESTAVFWTFLVLIGLAVMIALVWDGGWITGVTAAALILLFIGIAAWVTWHAALDRKLDERRVADEMRSRHRAGVGGGFGHHAGRPM